MGCSPSHALIINSNSRPVHDSLCLQPRIYMVSESTLRILQDVGELRVYQHEDKDPGVARVRFGTNTIEQLENPLKYQPQLRRQSSLVSDVEPAASTSSFSSKKTGLEMSDFEEAKEDIVNVSEREKSASRSSIILAEIHSPRLSPENNATEYKIIHQNDGQFYMKSLKKCEAEELVATSAKSLTVRVLNEQDLTASLQEIAEETRTHGPAKLRLEIQEVNTREEEEENGHSLKCDEKNTTEKMDTVSQHVAENSGTIIDLEANP
ncbi:predicted protein [Nematostella vectensis]|uniref:Uncharacterized protein n=1 Tax=Nematostella vectensis TaxID=45351 RepID=A7SP38_NEMVE|nr:uncharacterized protein LOC5505876 [Nematostella vectensis]EDO34541.1 predicted protein [Nematostella vectensis]|eukprot:XP_001626641.1 predicted protein [Nematostella vectensis]